MDLEQVRQHHRRRQVRRVDLGAVRLRRQAHARQRRPQLVARGAAAREHAGFGRAEHLAHLGAVTVLGRGGQFPWQRRGRRDDAAQRRQRHPGLQQRAQVHRRGHQQARAIGLVQRAGHVGGEQRLAGMHRRAAEQRQHHRHLHAVHVLRRHRGHHLRLRRAPQVLQRRQVLHRAGGEGRPGLGVRLRPPGAPGGVADRGQRVGFDRRHRRIRGLCLWCHRIDAPGFQAIGTAGRMRLENLGDRAWRAGRRQQRHLPAQGGGAEAQQEAAAVLGQVHDMAGVRQAGGERAGLLHELAEGQRALAIEHQDPVRMACGQRQPAALVVRLDDGRHRCCPVPCATDPLPALVPRLAWPARATQARLGREP